MRTSIAALIALSFLIACGVKITDVSIAWRSGTPANDFVEDPLIPQVKQYERALERSNEFLDALKAQDFASMRALVVGPPLDDEAFLAELFHSAERAFGPWKEHKPLQWNFGTDRIDGATILYSFKIVEHERGRIWYRFAFLDDGRYERVIAIRSRAWTGPLPAGGP